MQIKHRLPGQSLISNDNDETSLHNGNAIYKSYGRFVTEHVEIRPPLSLALILINFVLILKRNYNPQ